MRAVDDVIVTGDEEITALDIPHGIPLLYELGPGLRLLSPGRYLG